ncbi:helix-turn-helix transcriptional regulator [Bdellovibrio sp. SKB1291214]|uniref:helix-turn-helix domain-containing protein n=1 Tax=Bdellovibrio sp. SKB1291214 TaxID=1732569 RepID=UPI001C3D7C19|nr:helix-turn-helix transcriptional regulator [Bdellovibrio sp. SKB1291214]UYL09459.1 helix-turn-helix transcriptional regulator [Bdellovibrio sp. SKB1291214]
MALSNFIKSKRIDNFLTQQEAAVLLGYKKSQFLSNLECGKRKPPLDVLQKMCEVYHVERSEMRDEYIKSATNEAHQLAQEKWDSQQS